MAYLVGAAVAVGGCALAARTIHRPAGSAGRAGGSRGFLAIFRTLQRPDLALVSLGNLLVNWTFAGAITTFFPLYGNALGLSAATIGLFFALRAFVSALGRLPNGLIVRRSWPGSTATVTGPGGGPAAACTSSRSST